LRRFVRFLSYLVLGLAIALTTLWSALALWYRLPFPEIVRYLAAGSFGLLGLLVIIALFGRWRIRALAAFIIAFGSVACLVEHDLAGARRRLGAGCCSAGHRRPSTAMF
jgi:hypothetical protein